MWSIESAVGEETEARYDRRAAIYDRLIRSSLYNRVAWSSSPRDYARFAEQAVASARGPLLEVAAGSAAASAAVHARSSRPTVLVDLSQPMLARAARALSAEAADERAARARIRLVQADMYHLPFPPHTFATVLALGVAHLMDDLAASTRRLSEQLTPDGQLHIAGLVAATRRGRHYLDLLHRAGETAAPRTADEMRRALGEPRSFFVRGCMAYAVLPAPRPPGPRTTGAGS